MKHIPMYMSDYVKQLDNILSATGEKLLSGPGSVSHQQAMKKPKKNIDCSKENYRLLSKLIWKQ